MNTVNLDLGGQGPEVMSCAWRNSSCIRTRVWLASQIPGDSDGQMYISVPGVDCLITEVACCRLAAMGMTAAEIFGLIPRLNSADIPIPGGVRLGGIARVCESDDYHLVTCQEEDDCHLLVFAFITAHRPCSLVWECKIHGC